MKVSAYFGRLTWDTGSSSKGRGMHASCFLSEDPRIGALLSEQFWNRIVALGAARGRHDRPENA